MFIYQSHHWIDKIIERIAGTTMSCNDATRLMSKSMDEIISLRKRIGIRLHCATCYGCCCYRKHLEFIREVSTTLDTHLDESLSDRLPPPMKERLKKELKRKQR